uniref:Chemokine-like protein TAFA-5 n=1 Tax=Chelydra serpentina TaxID=8475 RepID=A0A8C3TD08_CHESE
MLCWIGDLLILASCCCCSLAQQHAPGLPAFGCWMSPCLVAGKELEVGMCEITALNRDLSHPRRMIARQTARCACRRGQVAGTTRAKPACVDAQLIASKQWCGMEPCDEGEQCTLLINRSGWSCTRLLGRIKTVTVSNSCLLATNPTEMGDGTSRGWGWRVSWLEGIWRGGDWC